MKVMLIFFILMEHAHKLLPQRQAVNCLYYIKVLKYLKENVQRKDTSLGKNNYSFLCHGNGSAHMLSDTWLFGQNQHRCAFSAILIILSGISNCLFYPKLKSTFKGWWFQMIENIKQKLLRDCWQWAVHHCRTWILWRR